MNKLQEKFKGCRETVTINLPNIDFYGQFVLSFMNMEQNVNMTFSGFHGFYGFCGRSAVGNFKLKYAYILKIPQIKELFPRIYTISPS